MPLLVSRINRSGLICRLWLFSSRREGAGAPFLMGVGKNAAHWLAIVSEADEALRSARRSENALRVFRPRPPAWTGVSDSAGKLCTCACTRVLYGSLSSRPNAWVSNGVARSSDVETA
ncbi:hypothetical protein D3C72_1937110 [compost metagenome]